MQTLIERAGGLNVHQATVAACLLIVRKDGKVQKQMRTFGTTTREFHVIMPAAALYGAFDQIFSRLSKAGIGFCKVTIWAQFVCHSMVDNILERD